MKILYLHQYFRFPDQQGGTRSYDLAYSFSKAGFDVTVVTATSEPDFDTQNRWNITERDGLKIYSTYLPYGNQLSYLQRSIVFFKFLWFSTFLLLKLRGDVVLATSTPLTIGIPALIKKWIGGTPFIFETRDIWPEAVIAIGAVKNKVVQKIMYWLEALIYKNAVAIVPLSTDMQKSIVGRFPAYASKTSVVIENISEIERFQEDVAPINLKNLVGFEPRFSVLYAGTFGRVNGIEQMVLLAERIYKIDDKLVFLLMGTGAEKEKVKQLAQDKGLLGKNVFVLDPIKKNELPGYYKAVSMGSSFVIDIPALFANSANKFFDSLAAGRPVLINHEGWQAHVIREKQMGFVLPFEITDAAVNEFIKYTQDIANFEIQSRNALEVAKADYSLEHATMSYLTILNKIKG